MCYSWSVYGYMSFLSFDLLCVKCRNQVNCYLNRKGCNLQYGVYLPPITIDLEMQQIRDTIKCLKILAKKYTLCLLCCCLFGHACCYSFASDARWGGHLWCPSSTLKKLQLSIVTD